MARRRRASSFRRRRTRRAPRKKNLLPTKVPTTFGSFRYQWRQLTLPSKGVAFCLAAGMLGGPTAVAQLQTLPAIGKYAAMFAQAGAKITKKA